MKINAEMLWSHALTTTVPLLLYFQFISAAPPPISRPSSIHFLIPGTSDSLIFNSFGHAIPPFRARDAVNRAFKDISAFVEAIPQSRVPKNQYKYHADNGVSITVSASMVETMTWGQLDEILTGLGCFMTGINPAPGRDEKSHYQELRFSVYMREVGYLGSGSIQYKDSHNVAAEKRAIALNRGEGKRGVATGGLLQLPSANDASNGTSTALKTEIPFRVPHTPVTLVLTPLEDPILTAKVMSMLSNARSKIAPSVTYNPDDSIPRNYFEYSTKSGPGREAAFVLVHACVNQKVSWRDVDDVLAGLIQVVTLGQNKYIPGLRFEVDLEGRGEIGLGKVWYNDEYQLINERATPPATPALPENGNLAQRLNGSLSSPTPLHPLADQTHVPYPVVNSTITLIFTEIGNIRIPIDTVTDFFLAVSDDIQSLVNTRPDRHITPHLWFFKDENRVDGSILSISIYTRRDPSLSWLQLQKLLKGLEPFMSAQRTTLVFDIAIKGHGVVAEGLVWYTPPRALDGSAVEKRAISTNQPLLQLDNDTRHPPNISLPPSPSATRLTAQTSYPVPSTPVTLLVTPNGRPIPILYVEACLATALRIIARRVAYRPNERIPGPSYSYYNDSDVGFTYLRYLDRRLLTWQQLNWVLVGILGFVQEHKESCREMVVEIDILLTGEVRASRFGALMLWYAGDEVGVSGQSLVEE